MVVNSSCKSNSFFLTHCMLVDSSTVILLDESICHFRSVWSSLSLLFYFDETIVEPDQASHYVASELGLHCLPMTLLWVSR